MTSARFLARLRALWPALWLAALLPLASCASGGPARPKEPQSPKAAPAPQSPQKPTSPQPAKPMPRVVGDSLGAEFVLVLGASTRTLDAI
ncbi:hypothetical protein AwPolaro_06220 [Polaromonas sp.]|nr:hypothetical protein AwPolaro_06220 [Polaromonas sp.]